MKATIYTTLYENGVRKTNLQKKSFEEDRMNQELRIVNLYPQVTFQEFEGFGGAITEAVGVTLEKMPKAVVQEIMGTYFGPNGMGYRFIRTHLDSCDFSLSNYSALDDESDMDMRGFSLDRDQRNILPYIEAASARQGEKVPWAMIMSMISNTASTS
jgi:glucosylceramidase